MTFKKSANAATERKLENGATQPTTYPLLLMWDKFNFQEWRRGDSNPGRRTKERDRLNTALPPKTDC